MKICHISDSHGAKFHTKLIIPECDVLIHSGDIGGRTTSLELAEFLEWFSKQPGKIKLWIAGNHDLCMDKVWADQNKERLVNVIKQQIYSDARKILEQYPKIKYLENTDYVYEGVKFYGSPITPSFHRTNWAFNADRGTEIAEYWKRIPDDVDVLITHGPPYGILDTIPERFKQHATEDIHRGCKDLKEVIDTKLYKLKLHCFGHLHNHYGAVIEPEETSKRPIIYSNGSILDERYNQIITKPLIITI